MNAANHALYHYQRTEPFYEISALLGGEILAGHLDKTFSVGRFFFENYQPETKEVNYIALDIQTKHAIPFEKKEEALNWCQDLSA